MAKGQLRGNKEVKKQKQPKAPAAPAGGFIAPVKTDKTSKAKSSVIGFRLAGYRAQPMRRRWMATEICAPSQPSKAPAAVSKAVLPVESPCSAKFPP